MSLVDPNLAAPPTIATALGPLRDEVLFVGGAVAGLLITDPAAMSVRATDDVDCVVEIASAVAYHAFERRLRAQGFSPDPDMICRYRIENIALDVMPTDSSILGFANRWAAEAITTGESRKLGTSLRINMITAPYFVATKLEAFYGRGHGDFVASHDIEDVVAIVDGRRELLDEVATLRSEALRMYLREQFRALTDDPGFVAAIGAHLSPDSASQLRLPSLRNLFRRLASGA